MKIKARKIIIVVMVLILVLWIGGIIPQQIGRITAINYVQKKHEDMELTFVRIDYSPAHGTYFAVFKDSNGDNYSFQLNSTFLPTSVRYDPLNPPGP